MGASTNDWQLKQFVEPSSGRQTIIRKCLMPSVTPGDARYSHIAYLTFAFQPRDATGLPTPEDNQALVRIEEQQIPTLEADGLGVLVAVVLDNGVKDFLFYTGDPEGFLRKAAVIRDSQARFGVGCEVGPDAAWSHYAELP